MALILIQKLIRNHESITSFLIVNQWAHDSVSFSRRWF